VTLRRLIVEADGGSRGNPGPAGFGALVRDAETGSILARRNGFVGVATNNVAEYRGLIAGLQAAASLDANAAIDVRLDSKLLVEQMSGRWQVKHPDMRPLAREASGLASAFPRITFTWIPRAQNTEADKLANEAMDARRSTYDELDDAPPDATWLAEDEETAQAIDEALEPPVEEQVPLAEETRGGRPGWRPISDLEPARLVLLRHAQTVHSVDLRFSGTSDPALTELGQQQATRAARRIAAAGGIDAIITSPRLRTRATADLVGRALGLTPMVDEAWRECDFGVFEGLTYAEVSERYPAELAAWLADPAVPPPGGESFVEVTERVAAAQENLAKSAAGQRVLVVSHVTPIKVLGRLAVGAPHAAMHVLHLDLASISRLDVYADGPALLRGWNDTAHLDGLA